MTLSGLIKRTTGDRRIRLNQTKSFCISTNEGLATNPSDTS